VAAVNVDTSYHEQYREQITASLTSQPTVNSQQLVSDSLMWRFYWNVFHINTQNAAYTFEQFF